MTLSDIFSIFLAGVLLYAYPATWFKFAQKWQSWLPPIRFIVKWGMVGVGFFVIIFMMTALEHGQNINTFVGLGIFGIGTFGAYYGFTQGLPLLTTEHHKRGARIHDAASVKRMVRSVKANRQGAALSLGGVPIPFDAEPYHFMIAGSTGSGKSVAIVSIMDKLRERGDSALIVDSGGIFSARFYNPETDKIINPFDDRCAPWNPIADMNGPWDADALARSIVPDGVGESKEWNAYAQTLVSACLQKLWEQNKRKIKDLLYVVQAAPMKELEVFLSGTSAAAQLSSEKTFGSIRTIASNYLSAYSFLVDGDEPFSVSKFIRENKGGFVFLSYRDDQLDTLKNLISCVLDISSRAILSLKPDPKRRIWLIIDEFASIGKVQSIEAIATKARKLGGCLLIGVQSVSQVKDRYGDNAAQTILSCLSTWVVLRCSDPDTAEYMSKYLGEQEISRKSEGKSIAESGKSKSWNEAVTTQKIVMASEIQGLPNVQGFFKLSGHYPVCYITLSFPKNKPDVAQTFIERNFKERPMIRFDGPKEESAGASGGNDEKPALPPWLQKKLEEAAAAAKAAEQNPSSRDDDDEDDDEDDDRETIQSLDDIVIESKIDDDFEPVNLVPVPARPWRPKKRPLK